MSELYAAIRIDLNPIAWKAPTAFVMRRGGKMRAGMAPAPEVVAYQEAVKAWLAEHWDLPPADFECELRWWFNRRIERYQSADSGRWVSKHRQDLTNLIKSTEDALQPKFIKNDNLVVRTEATIVEQSAEVEDPYVEVEIWRV